MNFWECLPPQEGEYLRCVQGLRELRLRDGKPIKANVGGEWYYLGQQKLLSSQIGATVFESTCDDIVKKACNGSAYTYEKMLAQGFFTLSDGSRIGVCGVMGEGHVFRKYTSLCIRIAKSVPCATVFDQSVIVGGPPRSGKTTFLRDLAIKLSHENNVAVVDERGEISSCKGFAETLCDVFLFAEKRYAFQTAVRAMSPDWLICDELSSDEIPLLWHAQTCGVKVAASIHAETFDGIKFLLGDAACAFHYAVLLQKDTFCQTVEQF